MSLAYTELSNRVGSYRSDDPEQLWDVEEPFLVVQGTADTANQNVGFVMFGVGEEAVKRWLGCLIMAVMPDIGVDETLSYLRDAYTFHCESLDFALPEPAPRRETAGLALSPKERPDLVISG